MNLTANYAQPLRNIGQDLEILRVESFEMESEVDGYLIRGRAEAPPPEESVTENTRGSSPN